MLQCMELLVGFDAARLLAVFDQLLLLILAIAFQSSAPRLFRRNGLVCLFQSQLLLLQFFFDGAQIVGVTQR